MRREDLLASCPALTTVFRKIAFVCDVDKAGLDIDKCSQDKLATYILFWTNVVLLYNSKQAGRAGQH